MRLVIGANSDSAAKAESTRRFEEFDKLPFDGFDKLTAGRLRVCDTAGRLRMTLSKVEWSGL
jgi:hypothetical protein